MKRTKKRKLKLNKRTVRNLGDKQLDNAVGGATNFTYYNCKPAVMTTLICGIGP